MNDTFKVWLVAITLPTRVMVCPVCGDPDIAAVASLAAGGPNPMICDGGHKFTLNISAPEVSLQAA